TDPEQILRHPSQLYEALLEGVLLFAVLTFLRRFPRLKKRMTPLYLAGYGIARFTVEFFRMPDEHLGLGMLDLSRGQLLCILMIMAGAVFWIIQDRVEGTQASR
ncbi:MAG: prolipoprotein diacylglyceryl transferase, partial [Fibrobacterota bacterium]